VSRDALVLNAAWQPIEKVCWQRAFILIFQEKARGIEYYDEIIRTPNDEFYKPSVIVLKNFAKFPKRRTSYSKKMVIERDNFVCQYCKKKLSPSSATIDHVLPRARGGKSTFENTVAACAPCNTRKADKTLVESKMFLLRKPRKPYIHPLKGKIKTIEPEWEQYLVGVI